MTVIVSLTTMFGSALENEVTGLAPVVHWRPIVDNAKCAAAIAWSVPTLAGLGVSQVGAFIHDFGASLIKGKICFAADAQVIGQFRPVMQTLLELGCVAPVDDYKNPKYYTFTGQQVALDPTVARIYKCE